MTVQQRLKRRGMKDGFGMSVYCKVYTFVTNFISATISLCLSFLFCFCLLQTAFSGPLVHNDPWLLPVSPDRRLARGAVVVAQNPVTSHIRPKHHTVPIPTIKWVLFHVVIGTAVGVFVLLIFMGIGTNRDTWLRRKSHLCLSHLMFNSLFCTTWRHDVNAGSSLLSTSTRKKGAMNICLQTVCKHGQNLFAEPADYASRCTVQAFSWAARLLTVDLMMVTMCTGKLYSLLHSIVSFPTVNNILRNVSTPFSRSEWSSG
jgi:hypothetical protein